MMWCVETTRVIVSWLYEWEDD